MATGLCASTLRSDHLSDLSRSVQAKVSPISTSAIGRVGRTAVERPTSAPTFTQSSKSLFLRGYDSHNGHSIGDVGEVLIVANDGMKLDLRVHDQERATTWESAARISAFRERRVIHLGASERRSATPEPTRIDGS